MIPYNQSSVSTLQTKERKIDVFSVEGNVDNETVKSFGEEWTTFDSFNETEIYNAGDNYFDIVPETILKHITNALDVGCGTGRWSYYLSEKVGFIECIDPSEAVIAASSLLSGKNNIRISKAGVDNIPFADGTFDFVFSLGVLHHVPDTKKAVHACVQKLKMNGHILLYLYYNLENRGLIFKTLFHLSNSLRWMVSKLPGAIKRFVCDLLAIVIYMPFVIVSRILIKLNLAASVVSRVPLSWYADKSFNIIRNDSLDRFGTPLEQRFSKQQITDMLIHAGCTDIVFADNAPFWRVIAKKK
jgi:SAM-dependent methyltransferase